jgi:membrane protein DedA with SNARE-associated domain
LLASITQFVTDQLVSYGYVAIFVLTLLGSACVPIPSEVVLLFGGRSRARGSRRRRCTIREPSSA